VNLTTRLQLSFDQPKGETAAKLEEFGFKLSSGGAHNSRTMMLSEITQLLSAIPSPKADDEYRTSVVEQNVLGKSTRSTREKTYRYLRELYGLSRRVPLFVCYRELMSLDRESAPLLSLLVAWSRDPLLRASTEAVFAAAENQELPTSRIQAAVERAVSERYNADVIARIARNAAASWTQSGHLVGRTFKKRARVQPRPAALTLALTIGWVSGYRGEGLFATPWCQLLDLNPDDARELAFQAHREELISFKAVSSVVEIGIPRFDRLLNSAQ
jgi:hypothetical protein